MKNNSSKTVTVANQAEVPILHYVTISLNTTIEGDSRQFTIPFAVADIKYNFLGTPFFEMNIQNINIRDFTLQIKYQSTVHPYCTKFTSLLSKDYPYFSYRNKIGSKTQIRLKPNFSKIGHFPIKNYYNLFLQLHHKISSFLRFQIFTSLLIFVQQSTSLKFLQMINQTPVQPLYKILYINLQHSQQNILDI